MARGRVWQGIRDWFRPLDRAHRSSSPREETGDARSDHARIHGRQATLARIESEGGAQVIPFPRSPTGEAVLADPAFSPAADAELLDFLAADFDPVPADPAFRDRLRDELWEMVVCEGVGAPKGEKDR